MKDVHILISVPGAPSKTSTVDQIHTIAANCLHVMITAANELQMESEYSV